MVFFLLRYVWAMGLNASNWQDQGWATVKSNVCKLRVWSTSTANLSWHTTLCMELQGLTMLTIILADFSSKLNYIILFMFATDSISWRGGSTERSAKWAAKHFDIFWDQTAQSLKQPHCSNFQDINCHWDLCFTDKMGWN